MDWLRAEDLNGENVMTTPRHYSTSRGWFA